MNYKEKYEQVLERAKYALTTDMDDSGHWAVNYIFPELKEDNDERIRKGLIKAVSGTFEGNKLFGTDVTREEALAWLEKQGEHKPYGQRKECEDCQFNYVGECKGYCALKRNEQKPTDNVEPKFKVGDWVVNSTTLNLCHILKVEHGQYICDDCSFPITHENEYHLWTIQDAKAGDVLANDHHILILKELDYDWSSNGTPNAVKAYCGIKPNGNFELGKDNWCFCGTLHIHPATKEQCDLLFAKMKETGYEWDGEKKELKNIEVASKESEDERIRKELKHYLEVRRCQTNDDEEYINCNHFLAWLEKQAEQEPVQVKRKDIVWTEEDEKTLKAVLWHISNSVSLGMAQEVDCQLTRWVKSFKKMKQAGYEWDQNMLKKLN